MAFGFGFNKQKVLSAAEKFVQQGKLQNAITEYEKIIKADAKDLTVMNTVGDLYARLGENERAIECFKSVGDAYAQQGFTVKAIAMYKKLSKLRPTLEGSLRLAELYTQQGLFNDARAQYLQVAEEFLRGGELEQAVRIFQKTLEMDPENVSMRTRLAEVYIRLGKKAEAWDIFATAAESLRDRGATSAAEEILQRMLTLDPNNSHALLLRGRLAFDAGDCATAIKFMERVADLDNHAEGLNVLMQAYLKSGRLTEGGGVASKLASVHNDVNGIVAYSDALIAAGRYDDALRVFAENSDRLLAGDSSKILETLHYMIGHVRENTHALEILLDLLQKAGEQTHITEIYELLAHAYVQAGELEKARDYYLKLTQLEPHNQLHTRNYQQVVAKLGGKATSTKLITAEEGAVMVDELEATAPFIDQRYSDEVALAVRAALTDAELFTSYNMPAKALEPLLTALPKAPQDLRLNQRLAALHTRAERFAEAAVCCRTLQSLYHHAGHPEEANRYGELASKYEERAGTSSTYGELSYAEAEEAAPEMEVAPAPVPEMEVAEADVAEAPAAPVAAPVAPASPKPGLVWHAPASAPPPPPAAKPVAQTEFEVQAAVPEPGAEIDISDEWEVEVEDAAAPETAITEPEPAKPAVSAAAKAKAIAEALEEIRFYLSNGMAEQSGTALGKLEHLNPDPATLESIRAEIRAATAVPAQEMDEVAIEDEAPVVEPVRPVAPAPKAPAPKPPAPPMARPAATASSSKTVGDAVAAAGEEARAGRAPAAPVAKPQPKVEPLAVPAPVSQIPAAHVPPPAPPVPAKPQGGELGELVADLESSLGDFLPTESVVPIAAPPVQPPAAKREIGIAASAAAGPSAVPSSAPAPLVGHAAPVDPAGVDLAGMFTDLRHELEEDAAKSEEDPETHYNLGVAFREMGLLDEAIGELQKVCQAMDRGHSFPHVMQTYTWLAQCFLDKGVPEAAVRWYEQALKLPNLDGESSTALHYEIGSAYEAAHNKQAALRHFLQVYGSNIDYRDVSERIKALKS
jgi:tetratricopeptide (TPR) repeat protein